MTIECFDEDLGLHRHLMLRAIGEVNELLWVTNYETGSFPRMSVIRSTGRVSATKGIRHPGIGDGTSPSTTADREELAVPIRLRKPDLDSNLRIRRRCQGCGDPTKP